MIRAASLQNATRTQAPAADTPQTATADGNAPAADHFVRVNISDRDFLRLLATAGAITPAETMQLRMLDLKAARRNVHSGNGTRH
jgi:hypothetical protein